MFNSENANDNQSETQVWITSQIWFPKSRRLAATDQIFGWTNWFANAILTTKNLQIENWVNIEQTYFAFLFRTWYYNSLLVEQSLVLNRRSDDGKKSRKFDFKTKHFRQDFYNIFCYEHYNCNIKSVRSEMRGRPDDEEEAAEKKPKRKISAWWEQNLTKNPAGELLWVEINGSTLRSVVK